MNPVGLGVINQATGQKLRFFDSGEGPICEICYQIEVSGCLPSREKFNEEFDLFLQNNKEILFAHSGGLDSTVTLAKLAPECEKRNIKLRIFTLKHGVKGEVTERNLENVLAHLSLKAKHFYVDIADTIQDDPKILDLFGKPMTTVGVYKACWERNILPCGKICNTMFDKAYDRLMEQYGFTQMVTGGDTPKKNEQGIYSLFWKKPSGITIVRGAYAFASSKAINTRFIKENGIPWVNPECGGYDTDCLVPGVFFALGLGFRANQEISTIAERYPIILDYLTERVRFGIIDYSEAKQAVTNIDIASPASYDELIKIFKSIH
jgi:hypothetical protein